jgi:hypothetical protein
MIIAATTSHNILISVINKQKKGLPQPTHDSRSLYIKRFLPLCQTAIEQEPLISIVSKTVRT